MNKIGPAFETQSMRRLPKSDLDQNPGIALSRNWPARAGAAPTGLIRLRPPGRAVWGTRWDPNPLTELSSSRRNQSPRTRSCVPPGRGRPRFAQDDGPAVPSRARSHQVQIVQREKTRPAGGLYGAEATLAPFAGGEDTAAACSSGRSARPASDRDAHRPERTVGGWDAHRSHVALGQGSGSDPLRAFGKKSGTWPFPVPDLLSCEEP